MRGPRFTLIYFAGGFAFGILREFFYVTFKHNYDYSGIAIKIFGVPPVIPLGWIFTFYIGLCFGERIFGFTCNDIAAELQGADNVKAQRIWTSQLIPLLISVCIFTGIVCFAIESCAINMGWWEFVGSHQEYVTNPVQYMWTQTGIIFTTMFVLTYFKQVRRPKNILFLILFGLKYAAEDFLFDYLSPLGVVILWGLILVIPILFYEEFSLFYLILLFGGRLFPDVFFINIPGEVLILKLVFFLPQAIYFLLHLYPNYAVNSRKGNPLP